MGLDFNMMLHVLKVHQKILDTYFLVFQNIKFKNPDAVTKPQCLDIQIRFPVQIGILLMPL